MGDKIPARPADAKSPSNPTVKLGPRNLKISVHLPKINPEKALVYVKGTTFHCSTLSQQPKYYVTADLSAQLRGVGLDDEQCHASYDKGFLHVVVPLVGSPEQIEAARKWKDPEEMKAQMDQKAAAKRAREEEVASQQREQKGEQNKKKKQRKKRAAQNNNNSSKETSGEKKVQMDTNKRAEGEGMQIAAEIGEMSEKKVNEAVKKSQAKEEWLRTQDDVALKKRKKKKGAADEIRETVKEQVMEKYSKEGKQRALQEKKQKKKQKKLEQSQPPKQKKSVAFQ